MISAEAPAPPSEPLLVDGPEVETVGRFAMTVALSEPAPEAAQRWSSRAEALAGWLLAEWGRDRGEAN